DDDQRNHCRQRTAPLADEDDGDDRQRQGGHELVGRAEQRPDAQSALAAESLGERQPEADDDDEQSRGDVGDPQLHGLTDLLDDKAQQAHSRVHGGGGEQHRHGGQDGRGQGGRQSEAVLHQGSSALDEGIDAALTEGRVDLLPCGCGLDGADDRQDRSQRQQALTHRTEVADEAGVGLLVQLLRAGAGGDHPVEAGDGSAGDGDEQQRNHAGRALGQVRVDGRGDDFGLDRGEERGGEHRTEEEDEADEQLDAVDVVPRLQQHPHRQQRSDGTVDEECDDPEGRGAHAQERLGQDDGNAVAEDDEPVQEHDSDDGDGNQRNAQTVDAEPDEQRHDDRAPGRDDRGRRADEQVLDDDREGGDDHEQQQEDDDEEEIGPAFA